jgi:chromosomal replication initiation ATPase DnaA
MIGLHYWSVPGVRREERCPMMTEVIGAIADFYSIEVDAITGKGRSRGLYRFIVFYIMEEYGKVDQQTQANFFGYKSRVSVTQGHQRIAKLMEWDGEIRDCVEWVELKLFGWKAEDVRGGEMRKAMAK